MTESNNWVTPEINHGKLTKYNYIVQYTEGLNLGKNFDIGTFTYINAKFGVTIEDDVQIGSHCSIYSHSTIDKKQGSVILKKNCRIGTHSTIMPNVTIGENSIVAAHSFINKNIPKNEIWGGVPAKLIKKLE
jgi:acetyltransferase-like isoleucine patch superfamily enzyme|tara:strand:- start:4904 stop:5299 length:396 start_codon:yes stop_codon:yes gene_type:complete